MATFPPFVNDKCGCFLRNLSRALPAVATVSGQIIQLKIGQIIDKRGERRHIGGTPLGTYLSASVWFNRGERP